MTVGTEGTILVVLRGNSASGKSSVAAGLRARLGRGLVVVGQDKLRRTVLRERDRPGAANIRKLSALGVLRSTFPVVTSLQALGSLGDLPAQTRGDTAFLGDHRPGTGLPRPAIPPPGLEELLRKGRRFRSARSV
jgi:hypothetical protein